MMPLNVTYDFLEEMALYWRVDIGKSLSECTCLDCIDSPGPIRCPYIFDIYNFDGDCLNSK